MRNDIVGLAQQYAQEKALTAVKRVAIPAAFGIVAAVFFVIVIFSLFGALFYWLTSLYGPIAAALIVAVVALVLGLIALLPIMVKRQPPPPPPAPNPPQFASLLAQAAPAIALKRPLVSALLLAVALGMMARGASGKK
jgi:Putative Actinobacterial Holin-X, holin superfamily III